MSMDRAEHIGLGSAIGLHALLLLLLSLGLFGASEQLVRPEPIAVSLVGEVAPEATSPQPSEDALAPASSQLENSEPPAPAPSAAPDTPAPQVVPQPAQVIARPQPKPVAKTSVKPLPTPKPAERAKPAVRQSAPVKPVVKPASRQGGFGKGFEDRISGIGKASSPAKSNSANGTGTSATAAAPAGKPASEVRRSVTASLAAQIRPYLQSCAPSGLDIEDIRTFITLSLDKSGALTSARFDKQTGISASNSPQAEPLKQCALRAARQASPYEGLDTDYYDVWKNHALQLKAK